MSDLRHPSRSRRCVQIGARIGALVVLAAGVAGGLTPAVAAPAAEYRQLDGAGLISVLPQPAEAAPWIGPRNVERDDTKSYAPQNGLVVCYLSVDDSKVVRGAKADLGAYSFVLYQSFPGGGFMNTIVRILQFPDVAAADAAWSDLLVKAKACGGPHEFPYFAEDQSVIGKTTSQTTVRMGDLQYGSRSLVLTTRSQSQKTGASAPDRTGGGVNIWRRVGNVLVETNMVKLVPGGVRSSLLSLIHI